MEHLFIDYANVGLESCPEFFHEILEDIKTTNEEVEYDLMGGRERVQETVDRVGDTGSLEPANQYVRQIGIHEQAVFSKIIEFLKKFEGTPFRDHINRMVPLPPPGTSVPWDRDLNCIALEGAAYSFFEDGCEKCRFNSDHERDVLFPGEKPNCCICDQAAFRSILDRIIEYGLPEYVDPSKSTLAPQEISDTICLYELRELAQYRNKVVSSHVIVKNSFDFENRTFIKPDLISPWKYEPGSQQFAQFIKGVMADGLLSFLMEPKGDKRSAPNCKRLKRCRICGNYFTAKRVSMQNCPECKGEELPETRNERQRRYRRSRKEKRRRDMIQYWIKKGCKRQEIDSWSDEDLFFTE